MQSLGRLADQFEREALEASSAADPSNFVTLPRFEYSGRDVLDHGIEIVSYAPIIKMRDDGLLWENYSIANNVWIEESAELADLDSVDTTVTPFIWFGKDLDGTPIPAIIRPTPFVPLWQTSQLSSSENVINQDMHAFEFFPPLLTDLQQGSSLVISSLENTTAIWGELVFDKGNHAVLLYPVHNKSAVQASDKVMSALVTDLSWDAFMAGVMDTGAPSGVSFILGSSCGPKIVYKSGSEVCIVATIGP